MTIASYSILNYEQVQSDVAARSKLLLDYKTIIDRRIRVETEYHVRMRELAALPEMKKIPNATKATELIFNSLVNAVLAQVENVSGHVARLDREVGGLLSIACGELEAMARKQLNVGVGLIKDYDRKHEDLEKIKIKALKKAYELRKLKEQYIVGTLIDMPFDKKNKLFIRTRQVEQDYKPLKEDLEDANKKFNSMAVSCADKLKQSLEKLEVIEQQKVEMMKKIFMVLQISNSEYGANLIREKAAILSKLNEFQQANPQFIPCNPEVMQKNKKDMLSSLQDPLAYINKLFSNIVDTKNMQNLVVFGHEARHREIISQFMKSENINMLKQQVSNSTQNDQEIAKVKEVSLCFRIIFNEDEQYDQEKFQRLKSMMEKSVENRKNFILCLQKYRAISKFDISQRKLEHICNILNLFLDSCLRELDTYNSKLLLVLSFTYYVIVNNEKIDLHLYVKGHSIWRQKQWWECALLESSYQELRIKPPKKNDELPITIWDIKASGLRHIQNQNEFKSQNVLFNQLVFYVHNMRHFEIKEEVITYFAKKYMKYFQLNSKFAADMQPILKVQEVAQEDMEWQLCSPTGSPINLKRKLRGKFFSLT